MRRHYTSTSRVSVIISHNGRIREDLKTHIGGSGSIGDASVSTRTSGCTAVVDKDNEYEKYNRVLRIWNKSDLRNQEFSDKDQIFPVELTNNNKKTMQPSPQTDK